VTSYWCELAWLGGARAQPGVLISVEGERIAAVEAGVSPPPGDAERLPGVTLPGLANAHSHAFQRALRGRIQGGSGSFWTWREQMYALAGKIDPDSYLALARATFGEMALAGVTVVGEFHYLHHGPGGVPYEDPNAMGDAVVQAAAEAGVRITLIDACYLRGGFGAALDQVQMRFSDGDAEAWVPRCTACGPWIQRLREWWRRGRRLVRRSCTPTCPSSPRRTRGASRRTVGRPPVCWPKPVR